MRGNCRIACKHLRDTAPSIPSFQKMTIYLIGSKHLNAGVLDAAERYGDSR